VELSCTSLWLPHDAFLAVIVLNCFFEGLLTIFAFILIGVCFKSPLVNVPSGFSQTPAPYTQLPNSIYAEKSQTSSYV